MNTPAIIIPDILDAKSQSNFKKLLVANGGSVNAFAAGTSVGSIASSTYANIKPTFSSSQNFTWNSTNHSFAPNYSGIYLVIGQVGWSGPASPVQAETFIYKNGSAVIGSLRYISTAGGTVTATTLISLNTGDTIQLYGWQSSGSNLALFSSGEYTFLQMIKI